MLAIIYEQAMLHIMLYIASQCNNYFATCFV